METLTLCKTALMQTLAWKSVLANHASINNNKTADGTWCQPTAVSDIDFHNRPVSFRSEGVHGERSALASELFERFDAHRSRVAPVMAPQTMYTLHLRLYFFPLPALASSAFRLRVSAAFLPAADFCSAVRAAAKHLQFISTACHRTPSHAHNHDCRDIENVPDKQ